MKKFLIVTAVATLLTSPMVNADEGLHNVMIRVDADKALLTHGQFDVMTKRLRDDGFKSHSHRMGLNHKAADQDL